MPPSRLRYTEAFVIHHSQSSGAYYAWSPISERDLVIDYRYCPKNVNLLGKWVDVSTDDGLHVREVNLLSDRYESRVWNANNILYGEIKVIVQHHGRFKDQFEMYDHEYLGYVCDPRHLIENVERNGEYTVWVEKCSDRKVNARWKVSEVVGGPSNADRSRNTSSNGRIFSGLIHSFNMSKDRYFAWSPSLPRSTITIDFCYCPREMNMIGKWVEMEFDDKKRVYKDVYVLPDKFETRLKGSVFEIYVTFEHLPRRDGDFYPMFANSYFGNICDARNVLNRELERGAWYRGWIVYHREDGVDARWRLATQQNVEGPLNANNSRPSSRARSPSFENRRPRSPDRYSPDSSYGRRSPMRDRRSISPRQERRSRSRSPEVPRYAPRPSSPQGAPSMVRRLSNASRAPTTDTEDGDEWNQTGSSDDSDDEGKPSVCSTNQVKSAESSAPVTKPTVVPPWNPHANIRRPTPAQAAPSAPTPSKPQNTESEKKLRKLKMLSGRLGEFTNNFAAHEPIRTAMQLFNCEQYDEMMELIQKVKTLTDE